MDLILKENELVHQTQLKFTYEPFDHLKLCKTFLRENAI
jgi:hypothetical protein